MFNAGKVFLSSFDDMFISIVRDCSFFCVAKIPTYAKDKLVPINSEKYLKEVEKNIDSIAGVICHPSTANKVPEHLGCALSHNPLQDAYLLHALLTNTPDHYWTTFPSKIDDTVVIHPTAHISPTNVVINKGCKIGPNASIMERVVIGEGTSIGANSVIGTDAYEMTTIDGLPKLIEQAGGVRIGKGCVILSGVTISRSTFPTWTTIGDHCSFDNLVHIAHDCHLGKRVKMTACSMLSGRVFLGADVYVGPNATISNGVSIGDGSIISLGSVVVSNTPPGTRATGNFAIDHKDFIKIYAKSKSKYKKTNSSST